MIDAIVSSGVFPPVMLIFGEEDFLVESAARELYEAASKQDTSGMNCEVVDGDGMRLDQVLSIARSFPMMGDRRVVWVRNAEKLTASKETKGNDMMTSYLDDPTTTTFLLMTASLPKADGLSVAKKRSAVSAKRKISGTKYPFNVLLDKATWGEYPRMSDSQLSTWIVKAAKAEGVVLHNNVADFLVLRTGASVRELHQELDKLITYTIGKDEITEADVVSLAGSGRAYNVFELQRAIGAADLKTCIVIITKMLDADRQEMLILAMVSRYMLSLHRLIDCASMTGSNEIASTAGIPPFAIGEYFDALQRLGPHRIDASLGHLRNAEATLKSSSSNGLLILEQMITSMLADPTRV